jgi:hypothetical protein
MRDIRGYRRILIDGFIHGGFKHRDRGEVKRMLKGLIKSLENKPLNP